MELVVARYNEDLDWLDGLQCQVKIYNKGEDCGRPCEHLPNIGRESHTYLHHIISNYADLADVTVFAQADPFPHCADFVDKVNLIIDEGLDEPFRNLSNWVLQIQGLKCNAWPYHCWPNLVPEVVHALLGEDFNRNIYFGAGAIFAVSKKAIHQHPLSFYKKAIQFFTNGEPDTGCRGYGHAFERLWPTIFGD
ncbi:MAG: DUF3431 domain-containing protein [Sphingomonadales bacterium]|nr:DUF3431 domain-containing protein [Sphingomonadales bacterium]